MGHHRGRLVVVEDTRVLGELKEGTPGLDFPEIRTHLQASVDYLNEHGGMGGRPIRVEHCTAKGSPETSQACAQELVGKGVEQTSARPGKQSQFWASR